MPHSGAYTLTDLTARWLTLRCARCALDQRWYVPDLIDHHGDATLPTLLEALTAGCERRRAAGWYRRCEAAFVGVRVGV